MGLPVIPQEIRTCPYKMGEMGRGQRIALLSDQGPRENDLRLFACDGPRCMLYYQLGTVKMPDDSIQVIGRCVHSQVAEMQVVQVQLLLAMAESAGVDVSKFKPPPPPADPNKPTA